MLIKNQRERHLHNLTLIWHNAFVCLFFYYFSEATGKVSNIYQVIAIDRLATIAVHGQGATSIFQRLRLGR